MVGWKSHPWMKKSTMQSSRDRWIIEANDRVEFAVLAGANPNPDSPIRWREGNKIGRPLVALGCWKDFKTPLKNMWLPTTSLNWLAVLLFGSFSMTFSGFCSMLWPMAFNSSDYGWSTNPPNVLLPEIKALFLLTIGFP